jgi:hypothetical protein
MSTTNSNNRSSKKTVARKTEAPAVARRASAPAPLAPVDEDQVAALAYRYYVEGGYQQGHALDHWLRAETELRGR